MKTTRSYSVPFRFLGSVERLSDALMRVTKPGDAALVRRGVVRSIVFMCPCGCGEKLPINLDSRAGPAWSLYEGRGKLSLYPSVWREGGCGAHFIVWRSRVLVVGPIEPDLGDSGVADNSRSLISAVYDHLPSGSLAPFNTIAQELGIVPWDVLSACRQLVNSKFAREGTGTMRGCFGR
jgi:hypothetical protein